MRLILNGARGQSAFPEAFSGAGRRGCPIRSVKSSLRLRYAEYLSLQKELRRRIGLPSAVKGNVSGSTVISVESAAVPPPGVFSEK